MHPECVEVYGRDTLARRGFAFDGTLTAVVPTAHGSDGSVAAVTFRVERWFRGPGTPTTVLRSTGLGVYAEDRPDGFLPRIGDRLLVSGEGDIAWICGFTRPWSEQAAAEWAGVFGQR